MRIFRKNTENETEDWLILSDVSMGGFIIFLVIAIAYISRHSEFYKRQGIYDNLKKFDQSNMIDVLDDGTIRFTGTNGKELFKSGIPNLTNDFKKNLSNFLPKYFESIEMFSDYISEIRIEGHTDTVCHEDSSIDCYYYHQELSQKRAYETLKIILESKAFAKLNTQKQEMIKGLFVSVGYGSTKTLDSNGEYTSFTKLQVDCNKSRRVDFKILIKSFEAE
jgi:outer membrane protein OmpA-like peptidoglycan-associated protein